MFASVPEEGFWDSLNKEFSESAKILSHLQDTSTQWVELLPNQVVKIGNQKMKNMIEFYNKYFFIEDLESIDVKSYGEVEFFVDKYEFSIETSSFEEAKKVASELFELYIRYKKDKEDSSKFYYEGDRSIFEPVKSKIKYMVPDRRPVNCPDAMNGCLVDHYETFAREATDAETIHILQEKSKLHILDQEEQVLLQTLLAQQENA